MLADSIVFCISDAVGRSHGDVNCDSLLVQPVRGRITNTHTGRNERRVLLFSPPLPVTCCHAPQQYSWSSQTLSAYTVFMRRFKCQWACGLTLCHGKCATRTGRGEGRTWEMPLNYWEWLFGDLWLVAVRERHDKLRQVRITLSHFSVVYLSAFLCLTTSSLPNIQAFTYSVL